MSPHLFLLAAPALVAASFSAGLIVGLRPWLVRYALARPNARSSHKAPIPQGGGIAVVTTTIIVVWIVLVSCHPSASAQFAQWSVVSAAVALLALVGAVDDIRVLTPLPRLISQVIAVGMIVFALPDDIHVFAPLSSGLDRILMVAAGVWFVNLVNFMDGIDWMTVAEVVPITGATVALGIAGDVAWLPSLAAVALLGAMLGFAPFNRPTARLFLGDVGSLPIGLLVGWLLLQIAAGGHLTAAVLLPLYYLADASITLCHRIISGEPFWQAHRAHFYQRAVDRGLAVRAVIARVFLVNIGLGGLALLTAAKPGITLEISALAAGAALVGWLLINLSGRKLSVVGR